MQPTRTPKPFASFRSSAFAVAVGSGLALCAVHGRAAIAKAPDHTTERIAQPKKKACSLPTDCAVLTDTGGVTHLACLDGLCQRPCKTDSDCPKGICEDNVCARGCTKDPDCDDGKFCNGSDRCKNPSGTAYGGRCVITGTCPAGTSCDEKADECAVVGCDQDGDGFDAIGCTAGGSDCDDSNDRIHPAAIEFCDTADVDEDCNPTTFGVRDVDGDGQISAACCNHAAGKSFCGPDCDDGHVSIVRGAQVCDGADVAICGVGRYDHLECPGTTVCVPQPNGTGVCGVEPKDYVTPGPAQVLGHPVEGSAGPTGADKAKKSAKSKSKAKARPKANSKQRWKGPRSKGTNKARPRRRPLKGRR